MDLGGMLAASAALGFGLSEDDSVITALGAGATGIMTASTLYGFATVDRCRPPMDRYDLEPRARR
jgi:hypothetical protein